MKPTISDKYGRTFQTLRVSLLSTCNLGCVYCTMGEEEQKAGNAAGRQKVLSADQLLPLIGMLHDELSLKTIRLTGGEPLLYPQLAQVVKGVKELGIPQIRLTTNGFLLQKQALALKEAGMQSINVSLDAVDEDTFFLMSKRRNVQRILDGIDTALAVGLEVKLNTVLMKGINHHQVLPLLDYAFERNLTLRFLEVMSMGHLYGNADRYLVTRDEILHTIAGRYDFVPVLRERSATASYWKTSTGKQFGIIANESAPFCHDCNRLRLDSDGNMYGCLSSNHPIDIKNIGSAAQLREKLSAALRQKQPLKFTGSALSMLHIGG
ncbi:GTP 3',8-cyclase MoaA [Paraflavisolibacter sp. H34]|uniref:GTP 3',8-cyclase MoaA n=1 Tax=Huijunlia imazamoxiresistens TaxID=3127457 RepID=UPI003016962F